MCLARAVLAVSANQQIKYECTFMLNITALSSVLEK